MSGIEPKESASSKGISGVESRVSALSQRMGCIEPRERLNQR